MKRLVYFFSALMYVSLPATQEERVRFCVDKAALDSVSSEAKKNNKIVVIDFFAEWCGPCKMMAPTFEKLAGALHDTCIFAKVDVDKAKALAQEYGVQAMPTIIVTKEGKELGRMVGSRSYSALKEQIESYCATP